MSEPLGPGDHQRRSVHRDDAVTVCLAGDVMTGRGVDQILGVPGDPRLDERHVRDARTYVELAERRHGPIPRGVDSRYPWGEVIDVVRDEADVSVVNLETAVTDGGRPWPGKGIHYRMHPANVGVLTAAALDCCTLANNHALDWSVPGLSQTLETLEAAGIATVGAGTDDAAAWTPAAVDAPRGRRVAVIGLATRGSGVPPGWAADRDRPGVAVADRLTSDVAGRVRETLDSVEADLTIVSIHWGPNWGYEVPDGHRRFAHRLVDEAGVDVVHGHSSHHPLGLEVHGGRPVLYGCGDLITDYEGIGGHEEYRPDLGALYLATISPSDGLRRLELVPTRMRRLRLERAPGADAEWLAERLSAESARFGASVDPSPNGRLQVHWGL